jgi:hypothetical protein
MVEIWSLIISSFGHFGKGKQMVQCGHMTNGRTIAETLADEKLYKDGNTEVEE